LLVVSPKPKIEAVVESHVSKIRNVGHALKLMIEAAVESHPNLAKCARLGWGTRLISRFPSRRAG
jgi:hypothetical protein